MYVYEVIIKLLFFVIAINGRLQTKVAQVTRNDKFTQNDISYLKAFLLHTLLKNVYHRRFAQRAKV